MIYPIVKYGDPVLEREADTVTEFDTPELHKFLDDMFESMYVAKGVGLAAPQIGVGRKIAVIGLKSGLRRYSAGSKQSSGHITHYLLDIPRFPYTRALFADQAIFQAPLAFPYKSDVRLATAPPLGAETIPCMARCYDAI